MTDSSCVDYSTVVSNGDALVRNEPDRLGRSRSTTLARRLSLSNDGRVTLGVLEARSSSRSTNCSNEGDDGPLEGVGEFEAPPLEGTIEVK